MNNIHAKIDLRTPSLRQAERDELKKQTLEFEHNGGHIEKLPNGFGQPIEVVIRQIRNKSEKCSW